jgi:hypothetical protein
MLGKNRPLATFAFYIRQFTDLGNALYISQLMTHDQYCPTYEATPWFPALRVRRHPARRTCRRSPRRTSSRRGAFIGRTGAHGGSDKRFQRQAAWSWRSPPASRLGGARRATVRDLTRPQNTAASLALIRWQRRGAGARVVRRCKAEARGGSRKPAWPADLVYRKPDLTGAPERGVPSNSSGEKDAVGARR